VSAKTQVWARRYIERDLAPIPVPPRTKNPNRPGWQDERVELKDVPHLFGNGQNIGVLNGEPSGWKVCADFDVVEAAELAGRFMPPTLTSGRESRPHSHWWFISPGAKTEKFKDVDGTVLLELRSSGCQTIVAPSTHPSGDRYVWHSESGLKIAHVEAAELKRRLRELATAALIARHLPKLRDETTGEGGGRHDYALALSGFLLRSGRLEGGTALKILKAAWDARGWPDERSKREARHDLEGIVRDTVENLAAGEPVVGGPTLENLAPGVVRLLYKWWGWERKAQEETAPAEKEEERKPTQAELLIRCAEGVEFFHTPAGDAYARIKVGDHRETHLLRSKGFRRYLVRDFFERYGKPPGAQALQDALGLLEARAQFDGPGREVHVRVADHGGNIYVDLANERWEAVEITPGVGWRVVSSEATPVYFRRPRGMLPLPVPARSGLVEELRRFVNISDEASWRLLVAWLIQALRPKGPYPVLILQGEQGSAKSTVERLVRALVDPSTAPLRTTPRNERDLIIAATNSWCVAFDNISNLPPWASDALCRLSTGGGFSARELYTDAEEVLFDATRPVILNGITDVATRPDLLDRGLITTLPPIPEEDRKPESGLWRDFEKARPAILGALFDAVSGALGAVGGVRLEGMPRMADFAVWATAAEDALGWESGAFMGAYIGNRREATESALEADPVAGAVRVLMEKQERWAGTATELWQALNELVSEDVRHTKAWPAAPNSLTSRLKRLAPALRGVGIEYGEDRSGSKGTRLKTLTKKEPALDRQSRQDRQFRGEPLQNTQKAADSSDGSTDSSDDARSEDRQHESPANKGFSDSSDSSDGDLRRDSNQRGSWTGDPMRHYGRGGSA
jgi:hypothetical protein